MPPTVEAVWDQPYCRACQAMLCHRIKAFVVTNPHPAASRFIYERFSNSTVRQYASRRWRGRAKPYESQCAYCVDFACNPPVVRPPIARFAFLLKNKNVRKRLANSWLKQVRVCDVKLHELAAKLERFKHLDDIGAGHVLAEIGTVAARRSEIKTVESATIAALEHQTIEKTPYCKAIRDALKKLHGRIFEGLTNKAYFTELVEIIIGTKSPWCATSVQPLSTCHGTQFMPLVQAEAAQFLRAGGIAMGTPLSFPTSTAWSRPPPVTMYRLLGPSPVTWCYTSGALPGPASAGSMQSPLPRLALLPP